ncbi:hypothetical protein C0Q70_04676 [Pomacea canaliculata]|uniref:Uncharacterized protein n=1 Tax=Pomacea canaliculata TaxID=400727 RepID=A0A2T7PJ51_POMCA|nr:hypothetical protein C0Q70_04676 [Pomacea canaliculata]
MEKGRREKLTSVQQPVSGDRANQAVLGGWPGAQGASVNSHVTTHHFSVERQVERPGWLRNIEAGAADSLSSFTELSVCVDTAVIDRKDLLNLSAYHSGVRIQRWGCPWGTFGESGDKRTGVGSELGGWVGGCGDVESRPYRTRTGRKEKRVVVVMGRLG